MPGIDAVTLSQIRRRITGAGTAIPKHPGFESKCIQTFDYDLELKELTIEFVERGTYVYEGVPLNVYVEFAESESQGRYFNLYIREVYSFRKEA